MAEELRVLIALVKDLNLVSSSLVELPVPGESGISGIHRHYTHTCTCIHIRT